jgi:transcriptional regulator with XRE-family HTH domain
MDSIWDNSRIQDARTAAGIKAKDAADLLKITPEYLSMVENGQRCPSQKLLVRMTTLYRVPVSSFLKGEKNFAQA